MSKVTFKKTDDYHIEWEIVGNQCHIHCLVFNFSNSVLKRGYLEFVRLRRFVGEMGYTYMVSVTPNPKFCELFGAFSVGTAPNGNEVMIWEIPRKPCNG